MARTKKLNGSSSASTAIRGFSADFGPGHADTFRSALIAADLVDSMDALPG